MKQHLKYLARRAAWPGERERVRDIRRRVFVAEQGIPEALEWDGQDDTAIHVLAETDSGLTIGTARLLPDGQIGRMAVLPPFRGHGVGRLLLLEILELARETGIRDVFLHAQVTATAFYARHGFEPTGAVFDTAGIPHQRMRMTVH